jgi:hypothetical protein
MAKVFGFFKKDRASLAANADLVQARFSPTFPARPAEEFPIRRAVIAIRSVSEKEVFFFEKNNQKTF